MLGGGLAGDGRQARILRGHLGCVAIARHRHTIGLGPMGIKPLLALRQRLGMGHDLPHGAGLAGGMQEPVVNRNRDLGADLQGRAQEQVERATHRSLNGIFNGQQCHIHQALLGHGERLIKRGTREVGRTMAKQDAHGLLAVGAGWAQVRDAHLALERPTAGDDLEPDGCYGLIWQWAFEFAVGRAHPLDDGHLPLGPKHRRAHLVLVAAHLLHNRRPLGEQGNELVIEGIDAVSKGLEHLGGHACSFSKAWR